MYVIHGRMNFRLRCNCDTIYVIMVGLVIDKSRNYQLC